MRLALALAVIALLAPATAVAGPPPFGGLTHLGCVSVDGSGGACSTGHALEEDGYPPVVLSPDGRNAYAGQDDGGGAIAVFSRDTVGGVVSQLPGVAGCVSEDGTGGQCADGVALVGAFAAVVSPDGANVYVSADQSNSVTAFMRDPATGTLTQLPGQAACLSDDGTGGACAPGRALTDPRGTAVSPDGRNVYVASAGSSSLTVFSRDAATGALTQLGAADGCVLENAGMSTCADGRGLGGARGVTVSPDGLNVYVASDNSSAIAIFSRDPATGAVLQLPGAAGCISATGNGGECDTLSILNGPRQVALSPDGRNAYVTIGSVEGGVAVFARDTSTGALTLLPGTAGCVTENGSAGACADGFATASGNGVGVSPDGRSVYLASIDPTNALTTFDRDPATGALTQLPGTAGCATETGEGGACLAPPVFHAITSVAIPADGRNLYALADGASAIHSFARELPPTCTDLSRAVRFGAPTVIPLTCSDPNGDSITRTIVAGSPNGTLAAVNPNGSVLYTPRLRFRGADSFTFRASDGRLDSNLAVAALSVTPDTIRPRISRASVSPRVFAVTAARAIAKLKRATTFRYRLSEPARVVVTIKQAKGKRHGRGKRFVKVGRLTQRGTRGANSLRFKGRIGRKKLKPGTYRAVLVAADPAGNRSKPKRLGFRIVRARR